jgi:hypothetical protein
MAWRNPSMGIRDHQLDALEAALDQPFEEPRPEWFGLGRSDAETDDLAAAFGRNRNSDYRGDRDDAAAVADLQGSTARSWTVARADWGGRKRYRRGRSSGSQRSDDSNPVTAVGAVGERCRLNSRGDLNILSEARVHALELISHRISVDPIEEKLCPSFVSREVRR